MKDNKIIFGLILIGLGILFLVDQTGIFGTYGINLWSLIWKLWPLILVFFGIKFLIERNSTAGLIFLILGTLLLLSNLFTYNFWSLLWPLLIIGIGISILFKDETKIEHARKENFEKKEISKENFITQTVVFFGWDKVSRADKFRGGEVNVAFGGVKLDLRDAKIDPKGATLHVNCAFGGVEVLVPSNCRVISNGSGIFGGWAPKLNSSDVEKPVLRINGVALFGGVELK